MAFRAPVSSPAVTEPVVPTMPAGGQPDVAAAGPGWRRVAQAVAERMPVAEIERIWLFPPVRREVREWGTAVVVRRVSPGRVRVYTGSYGLVVRGRERGQGQVTVEDVAETPDAVLPDVIRGVQERAGEEEFPDEIAASIWFPGDDQRAAAG
jgi:hypothetical protein